MPSAEIPKSLDSDRLHPWTGRTHFIRFFKDQFIVERCPLLKRAEDVYCLMYVDLLTFHGCLNSPLNQSTTCAERKLLGFPMTYQGAESAPNSRYFSLEKPKIVALSLVGDD